MLIDCTPFAKGPRHILSATLGTPPNPNHTAVNEAIEAYIADCQGPYLEKILGRKLGNKIHTYLVCRDEDPLSKQVESFDEICGELADPFADYVFFHILRDAGSKATITGLVRLKCAKEYVSPMRRQVTAWNSMVDRNNRFIRWAAEKKIVIDPAGDILTKINTFNL